MAYENRLAGPDGELGEMSTTFAGLPAPMFAIDEDGVIRRVSTAALDLFGYTAPELLGQRVEVLVPHGVRANHAALRAGYAADPQMRSMGGGLEISAVRRNGEVFPAGIALSPVRSSNGTLLIVAMVRDLTEATAARERDRDALEFLRTIAQAPTLEQSVRTALTHAARSAECDFGCAWAVSLADGKLHLLESAYGGEQYRRLFELYRTDQRITGEGMIGRAWAAGRLEWVPVIGGGGKHTLRNVTATSVGLHSAVAIPVEAAGEVCAIFYLAKREEHGISLGDAKALEGMLVGTGPIFGRKIAADAYKRSAEMNESLVREIHHRVKNNFAIITSLLHLQGVREQSPTARDALFEAEGRVCAMALVHESLYGSEDFTLVDLGEYLSQLCSQMAQMLSLPGQPSQVRVSVDPVRLGAEHAIPCGLAVQELVTNSLKHARPAGKPLLVDVRVWRQGENLSVRIRDNGAGYPAEVPPEERSSLGLSLVRAQIDQLGGALTFGYDGGAVTEFTFPIPGDRGDEDAE